MSANGPIPAALSTSRKASKTSRVASHEGKLYCAEYESYEVAPKTPEESGAMSYRVMRVFEQNVERMPLETMKRFQDKLARMIVREEKIRRSFPI